MVPTLSQQEIDEFLDGVVGDVFARISEKTENDLELVQRILLDLSKTLTVAAAMTAMEQGGIEVMDAKIASFKESIDSQIEQIRGA